MIYISLRCVTHVCESAETLCATVLITMKLLSRDFCLMYLDKYSDKNDHNNNNDNNMKKVYHLKSM